MHLANFLLTSLISILLTTQTVSHPCPFAKSHPSHPTSQSLHPSTVTTVRPSAPTCSKLVFRPVTGFCTNPAHPTWGQANYAHFTYIPGRSTTTPTGQSLKSPREISNILCAQSTNTRNSHRLNQLFTFFGQFLDHNLALTPENDQDRLDIDVPPSDPRLKSTAKLPFKRSVRTSKGVASGQRPLNSLTSAVDLVAVYGADPARSAALLELDASGSPTGKLKTSHDGLMPHNTVGMSNAPDTGKHYFVAGDKRCNEHPVLTAMHTLFMREHNRLVDVLRERIPSLSGKMRYEFARKLNIAQFQKIVFEEFYPAIIGSKLAPYRGFQRNVNPTVSDIFAGAAFRIGHTLVGMDIPRRGPSMEQLPAIQKEDIFFKHASKFSSAQLDNLVRGVANSYAQEVDLKVVDLLRNFLFSNVKAMEGFDLVALNLQRGRDHALPKFNEIRALFGIPKAKSFSDISRDAQTASNLAKAYDNKVDDVEAFVGLIGEDHMGGSGVGRTMGAVWKAEFTRLRDGDQFFYLNTDKFPELLRSGMKAEMSALRSKSGHMLRDVIVRNSGVGQNQVPSGDVFKIGK